jgi:tRNA-specific 2-thiouridylase
MAAERGLVTADKPESQEICFVPTGDYRDLLEERLEPLHPALQPGDIVTTGGVRVGSHEGFAGFTVGQRKGLPGGFPEPMFVVEVRAATREVVVGTRKELAAQGVELAEINWLDEPPRVGSRVLVQIRHRADPTAARLAKLDKDQGIFLFEAPQFAVSPGQSGVVFSGEQILGGGRITRSLPYGFSI